ncbi:DUF2244 domain-containing protein [Defluviimonas sp. SAOS-178_SWC]|uniref:DUF2244 domain-containing protein n=1 Tax=Defluviimonas sp. SAOS-178_SWC TaxID=3121287 RepID=UPI003221BFC4
MPYEWVVSLDEAPEQSGAFSSETVLAELHLWPFRSLPRKGFVLFIAITATMLGLPLMAMLGTVILWGILPFIAIAVAGVWWALSHSYRQGELTEVLTFRRDRIDLTRRAPDGAEQSWQANPFWVRVHFYPEGGPVPSYLTLKGEGREVELGAFLSEEERKALYSELREHLSNLR